MVKIIIRQKNNPTCISGVQMIYLNAGVISIMHQLALQVLDSVKLHFRLVMMFLLSILVICNQPLQTILS